MLVLHAALLDDSLAVWVEPESSKAALVAAVGELGLTLKFGKRIAKSATAWLPTRDSKAAPSTALLSEASLDVQDQSARHEIAPLGPRHCRCYNYATHTSPESATWLQSLRVPSRAINRLIRKEMVWMSFESPWAQPQGRGRVRNKEKSVYTDPGSGLFFMQVIIAAALTAGYRFRRLLTARFGKRRSGNPHCGS